MRWIFEQYAAGKSARTIAQDLNRQAVPGPSGLGWGASTIAGNPKRGTGILNNELYIGRLVWNRLACIKDPATGLRDSRPSADEQLVVKGMPGLRIVSHELWQRVKDRQDCGWQRRKQTRSPPPSGIAVDPVTCSRT